jgi:hypothetical protein
VKRIFIYWPEQAEIGKKRKKILKSTEIDFLLRPQLYRLTWAHEQSGGGIFKFSALIFVRKKGKLREGKRQTSEKVRFQAFMTKLP